jgi:hypothetical protein
MIRIRAILFMLKDMFFGNKNKEITTEHELVEKFKEADLAYGYYDENRDYEKMANLFLQSRPKSTHIAKVYPDKDKFYIISSHRIY